MSKAEGRFWRECDRHHCTAREFDQNVEITHPNYITSRGVVPMVRFFNFSEWAKTSVKYFEHRP